MGQYGNQPDFGTIVTTGDKVGSDPFPPSAIYVGKSLAAGGVTIEVLPAGQEDKVAITGIQDGTFLPIVVTQLINVSNILADNVLFYR
jgi:hypothetical protein